jgi:hypothetical protein
MQPHASRKNVFFQMSNNAGDYCPDGIRALLEARLDPEHLSSFHAAAGSLEHNHAMMGQQMGMSPQALMVQMQQMAGGGRSKTGRYRYNEASYDVNEQISALGLLQLCHDPYTGKHVHVLSPPRDEMLDAKFFALHNWTKWDQKAWHECEHAPHVMLSADKKGMHDEHGNPIEIPPVPPSMLPQHMTTMPAITAQNFTPYTPPSLVYVQPGAPTPTVTQPVAVTQMLQPDMQPPVQSDHPYHQAITVNNLHDKSGTVTHVPDDPLDTIMKLKKLLDIGAITQMDFDQKKSELLNLGDGVLPNQPNQPAVAEEEVAAAVSTPAMRTPYPAAASPVAL